MTVLAILHERLGVWARQLRPRFRSRSIHWVETRSEGDLENALAGIVRPIVLIDLARRPRTGLLNLDLVLQLAPDALTLVLDPEAIPGVPQLARELGATAVFSGAITPPAVAALLDRWFNLVPRLSGTDGWCRDAEHESDRGPLEWLADYIAPAADRNAVGASRNEPRSSRTFISEMNRAPASEG